MPTKKLPMQDGNSCAAHCTVIAIADMLNVEYLLSKEYAEAVLWPAIKFKGGEGPMTDRLAKADNSDPRRILAETETRWGGAVTARLMCDETEKARALTYVDAGTGWKLLDGQNKGAISYVFTGVCVALQRK